MECSDLIIIEFSNISKLQNSKFSSHIIRENLSVKQFRRYINLIR